MFSGIRIQDINTDVSQKGKEFEITVQLTRKSLKVAADDVHRIFSIFTVPKVPGRIYVEALSLNAVFQLCRTQFHVYCSSVCVVPIAERIALLQGRGLADDLIKKGSLVKIRNGLYKDDVGTVVSRSEGYEYLTIKLRSREPLPGVLKRKRTRRDPYKLTKDDAKRLSIKGPSYVDFGKYEGFKFDGKEYTFDHHLLLDLRYDRVKRIQPAAASEVSKEASALTDQGPFPKFLPVGLSSTSKLPFPKFLPVGCNVWITGGDMIGATGFLVEHTSNNRALIDIGKTGDYSVAGLDDTSLIETDLKFVFRRFDIGDRVEVKIGDYKGAQGVVADVEYENGIEKAVLQIVEMNRFKPVSNFCSSWF